MMDYIYQAVKSIVIFLLLVTVLSNLLGQSSYKKYINIFVGLVLIIIVLTPILNIINSTDKVDQYFNQNMYKFNAQDMSEQLASADDSYKKIILKEYKESIEKQIQSELDSHKLTMEKVDITINEEVDSQDCGKILSLAVTATKESTKKKENTLDIDEVDQVIIDKIDINNADKASSETNAEDANQYDTVEELTVKEELSALYGIPENDIKIDIR